MAIDDLRRGPTMRHLLDAQARGEDIGHYGRLTLAMVGRTFLDRDELVALLTSGGGGDEAAAKALVQQVEERQYTPPSRQRLLAWSQQQDFALCPNPDDPNACNLYRELQFPDDVYEDIQEYRVQQFDAEEQGEGQPGERSSSSR